MNPEIDEATGVGPQVRLAQVMCRMMLAPHAFTGIGLETGVWSPKDSRNFWTGAIAVDRCQIVLAYGPGRRDGAR